MINTEVYKRFFEESPIPQIILDREMTVIELNASVERIFGYPRDQMLNLKITDFRTKGMLKYLKDTGQTFNDAIRLRRRTVGDSTVESPAGTFVVERHNIPVFGDNGELEHMFVIYNDVTKIANLMEEAKKNELVLTESADILAVSLSAMAKGDFTQTAEISVDDPLTSIKKDYNQTLGTLRNVLKDIAKKSDQLEQGIIDISRATDEISRASQQVAITAQKSSEGLKTQLHQLENVSREVSDLSASVEEIASTSQEVRDVSLEVAKAGESAGNLGNEAGAKMKLVQEISERAVNEITDLNTRMREISNIVKLITDVANQTNLLALNAAIEAARAGEHGRGFAVVAGEVRNLAGESKTATRNIEEVIVGITGSSQKTAEAMKQAYDEIISGIASVNNTINALNGMVGDVNITVKSVADISRATEDQANATNNVTKSIEHISQLLKEEEKSMEELAALSEESSSSTEEVASASSEIKNMAIELGDMVKKFHV